MPRVINAYTVRPTEIQPGDVMLFVIKAMVVRPGVYRIYRCSYDEAMSMAGSGELPQGSRISNERIVCEALFPTLAAIAEPDLY